jgi:hypothetical protein
MYIRGLVLLLLCLSFFPPHATSCILTQYNYILFLSLLPSPCFLCLSSRPSCPHPRLAQSPRLRSHRAKSTLAMPPSESRKVASPAVPCPPPCHCSVRAHPHSQVPIPACREFLAFCPCSLPAITLRCVEPQFSTELAAMSESTSASTESTPQSLVIVRIVANHIRAIEALTAASMDSLDHATLHSSYENTISLTRALHSSENLTDRFTTLATENEDLALERDAAITDRNTLTTWVTQLKA